MWLLVWLCLIYKLTVFCSFHLFFFLSFWIDGILFYDSNLSFLFAYEQHVFVFLFPWWLWGVEYTVWPSHGPPSAESTPPCIQVMNLKIACSVFPTDLCTTVLMRFTFTLIINPVLHSYFFKHSTVFQGDLNKNK